MIPLPTQIIGLLKKEIRLEWRQKYALNGLLLYVLCTLIIVYLSFKKIDPVTWATVFWIVLLFASVNAVAKSFMHEPTERQLYYYSLVSAEAVILSKIIYNFFLLCIISAVSLFFYILFMHNYAQNFNLFILCVFLGCVGFALCFTLISAIASKASKNATLMPILAFPLVIPILILLIGISKEAVLGVEDVNMGKDISILIAIDAILIALSYILFPYLWRD